MLDRSRSVGLIVPSPDGTRAMVRQKPKNSSPRDFIYYPIGPYDKFHLIQGIRNTMQNLRISLTKGNWSMTISLLISLAILSIFINIWFPLYFIKPPLFMADFRDCYYDAADAVLRHGRGALVPFLMNRKFVNWPIDVYLFAPFPYMGPTGAAIVFSILGLLAVVGSFLILTKGCNTRKKILVFFLFICNGPLWYSMFDMGNTTHFIFLLLILSLGLLKKKRMYSVGLLIGFSATIKPMISIFFLYFLYRRNWRAAGACAAIVAVTAVSSVAVFGWPVTRGWYEWCIVRYTQQTIGAFNNQSINAFLLRLATGPKYVFDWYLHDLPFSMTLVSKALAIVILALTTIASLAWRSRAARTGRSAADLSDIFDFSLLIAFCVITSPVSWTHYYLLLLMPWSAYITGRLPLHGGPLTDRLVWCSIILVSMPVTYPSILAGRIGFLATRTLASAWLIGAVLFLIALCRSGLLARSTARIPDGISTRKTEDTMALSRF
ncbi:glycosyltransferase family 87 protein [Gluconacetobacter diazotrophicus]|uniref:glycosyltransferase family 87 protein n=1 Tax=Gluconacetobacter diazotrophicus TaxID=33996 RepID=UPI0005B8330F|nr:glycosyltransferase family 87 protein [Gluconacetobacter diazotrophicus]